jgi:hypothetical protein
MKRAFFIFVSALNIATAHAKVFDDRPRIMPLSELSFEKIQELIQSKNSDCTVEFKEGTTIPLQFLTRTRLFSALIDPNLMLKAEKTCYCRVVNKKCYMSEDLIHWEKIGKFLKGTSSIQIKPVAKGGLILETTIAPHEDDESEEKAD